MVKRLGRRVLLPVAFWLAVWELCYRAVGQDLLDLLESGPDWLDDFDEQLFSDMVEKIVVVDNETLRFRLLNGLEVTEKIERTRR